MPELANVKHVFTKASAQLKNRPEIAISPHAKARRMRGFREAAKPSCLAPIGFFGAPARLRRLIFLGFLLNYVQLGRPRQKAYMQQFNLSARHE